MTSQNIAVLYRKERKIKRDIRRKKRRETIRQRLEECGRMLLWVGVFYVMIVLYKMATDFQ